MKASKTVPVISLFHKRNKFGKILRTVKVHKHIFRHVRLNVKIAKYVFYELQPIDLM